MVIILQGSCCFYAFSHHCFTIHSNSRLEELYLGDLNPDNNPASGKSNSEVDLIADGFDKSLVKGTSNNMHAPPADLRYNFDKEDCSVYIKLLTLFVGDKSFE